MIRVIIAEQFTLLREGINAIFKNEEDIEVAGSCQNSWEVIRLSRERPFDLLLIGISVYSLEIYQQIKRKQPKAKILIFFSDRSNTINIKNLIDDVIALPSNTDSNRLLMSIRIMFAGGSVSLKYDYLPTWMKKSNAYGLDIEEAMILFLLSQGASNYSISNYMFLSERALKNRLTMIYRKLSVKNRTKAVIKVIEEDLIL
jgi:two-component system, NarL family, response regulator DegU